MSDTTRNLARAVKVVENLDPHGGWRGVESRGWAVVFSPKRQMQVTVYDNFLKKEFDEAQFKSRMSAWLARTNILAD